MDNDTLVWVDDDDHSTPTPGGGPAWRILIVDDEPAVHRITQLALDGFEYRSCGLDFLHAYTAAQAIEILNQEPENIALILLDVVMESDDAGFQVVHHVRQTQGNVNCRIILRTGQPGQAPARQVIREYDINDYHSKAELSAERMNTIVYTALTMFDQLRQLQLRERQLEKAYADIEQLVYITSHDLQEPLLSITTLSRRLLTVNRQQLDSDGVRCIEFIEDAVGRMSGQIRSLLDHAKLGEQLPLESVHLEQLVNQYRKEHAQALSDMRVRLDCAVMPPVQAQASKIGLLLRELLDNAVKFRRADVGPHIRVESRSIDGELTYCVEDNGIGIAPEHHDKVFHVFQSIHPRGTYPGTGIGLAHCRKIVEQHGGRMWLDSHPGDGTTFYFTLPGT